MPTSSRRSRSSSRRSTVNPSHRPSFDALAPGTNAAIARKIARAASALDAALDRLESSISYLRSGSPMSQPGDIGRAAAEVETRRGILIGMRDVAET